MKNDLGTIHRQAADLPSWMAIRQVDITLLQNRANLHIVMKGGNFVTNELTPAKAHAKAA